MTKRRGIDLSQRFDTGKAETNGRIARPFSVRDILRLLFADAERELAARQHPNFTVLGAVTKRQRNVFKEWQRHNARANRLQALLRHEGLQAEESQLSIPYNVQYRRQEEWKRQQAKKKARLKALRTRAMIDLLDVTAAEAKAYIARLEQQIAKL